MHIKDPRLIPEHVKRMIDPSHRKREGITLQDEQALKIEVFQEKELHKEIRQLLGLKGIAYEEQRMDKRSTGTPGWPDFTFSVFSTKPSKHDPTGIVKVPVPCAWECKIGNKGLDTDQEDVRRLMQTPPNAWYYRIIRSQQEAADDLKALGI